LDSIQYVPSLFLSMQSFKFAAANVFQFSVKMRHWQPSWGPVSDHPDGDSFDKEVVGALWIAWFLTVSDMCVLYI
jgi:hypothetical protein